MNDLKLSIQHEHQPVTITRHYVILNGEKFLAYDIYQLLYLLNDPSNGIILCDDPGLEKLLIETKVLQYTTRHSLMPGPYFTDFKAAVNFDEEEDY